MSDDNVAPLPTRPKRVIRPRAVGACLALPLLLLSLLAVCLGALLLDWGAGLLLAHREDLGRDELVAATARLAELPRPAVAADGIDDDAVYYYRLALHEANDVLASNPEIGRLVPDVPADAFDAAPEGLFAGLGGNCSATRWLVEAARCNRCNWKLTYGMDAEPELRRFTPAARLLAYCLARDGEQSAARGEWPAALNHYLVGLRFSSDLGLGTLAHALAGIQLGRVVVNALGRLAIRVPPEPHFLEAVQQHLADVEDGLPDPSAGLYLDRQTVMMAVSLQARQWAHAQDRGIARLVPWRTVAAYRMLQAENVLRDVEAAAASRDYEKRAKLEALLVVRARTSWSQVLRDAGVPPFYAARTMSDDLRIRFRMVRLAFALEAWRGNQGRYPPTLAVLRSPLDAGDVHYDLTDGGYRLVSPAWKHYAVFGSHGDRLVVLERGSSSRGHPAR